MRPRLATSLPFAALAALVLSSGIRNAHADDGPSFEPSPTFEPAAEPPRPAPTVESALSPPRRPRPTTTLHTWLEGRLGATRFVKRSTEFGPAVGVAYGMAWQWLDVGIVGAFATTPVEQGTVGSGQPGVGTVDARQYGLGAELATRTSIGNGATFRLGLDPMYMIESTSSGARSLLGVDALAQLLFTIDDGSRPVWRAGIGFHGGRRWSTGASSAGEGWVVGADLVVRSWW